MHRSRCTRVHLQTPRCVYIKKKEKKEGTGAWWSSPAAAHQLSSTSPIFLFIPAGCLCPPSGSPEVLVLCTAGGELKMRQYEETIGCWDLKHRENRDDCICPQKGTTTTLPPILWLDGCQATASISAWLQPCHLLSHTHSTPFFHLFSAAVSVSPLSELRYLFFFSFWLMAKAEVRKRNRNFIG